MNLRQLNHLMRHARKDELYQEFTNMRDSFEPDYRRILLTLSPEDRQRIEHYLAASIAAQERITRTAYFMTPTR